MNGCVNRNYFTVQLITVDHDVKWKKIIDITNDGDDVIITEKIDLRHPDCPIVIIPCCEIDCR